MRRLQGDEGNYSRGSAFSRDTTRGQSDVTFPSVKEGEGGEILVPLTCDICGLQFGFSPKSSPPQNFCPDHKWVESLLNKWGHK